jgi:hypothetical protein
MKPSVILIDYNEHMQLSTELSGEALEPELKIGQSIGDSQGRVMDTSNIEEQIRKTSSDEVRDIMLRDEQFRTRLAVALEESAEDKIADLLKLGVFHLLFRISPCNHLCK